MQLRRQVVAERIGTAIRKCRELRPTLLLGCCLSLLTSGPSPAAMDVTYRVHDVVTDASRPKGAAGESYSRLDGRPSLNDQREIAFLGAIAQGSEGVFSWVPGNEFTIALAGDPAPGTSGSFCFFSFAPTLNDAGTMIFSAFYGAIDQGVCSPEGIGIFLDGSGGTSLQVSLDDPAPDTGAGNFCAFDRSIALAADDDFVFTAQYESCFAFIIFGGERSGLFSGSGASRGSVSLEGEAAPGTGGTLAGFGAPSTNAAGEVAFVAFALTGQGEDTIATPGVFRVSGGVLSTVAFPGDDAGDGEVFTSFELSEAVIDSAGTVYFNAETDARAGIYKKAGSVVSSIARTGETIPGGVETFSGFPLPPAVSASGTVAFVAEYGDPASTGVFAEHQGVLYPVVLEGAPLQNLPFQVYSTFDVSPSVNERGDVAFGAEIAGPGPASHGIFLATLPEPSGVTGGLTSLLVLRLLARHRRRAGRSHADHRQPLLASGSSR